MWFQSLVGFQEEDAEQVRSNIVVDGESMTSTVNGKSMVCGMLETPSLAELRTRVREIPAATGTLKVSEVVADVQKLHVAPENNGALFQVASQFNLLEMVAPSVTPECGVEAYENDHTQGPACAIACGAGTIYRNYFASVNGRVGQSEDNQIDCLHDLGMAIGNTNEQLWVMRNGYALATADGLATISQRLSDADESERDRLRQTLRIGLHWNTEVTICDEPHLVTLAYCSALPVAYSQHSEALWAEFAQLVLEASYEAAICASILNFAKTGINKAYLTLVGGGAFGNRDDWIFDAIRRALNLFHGFDLDVFIVSYGAPNPRVQELVNGLAGGEN